MYVRISARTQGWHPPAYHALQAVARTRHTMMARSRAASIGSRGGPAHKIAARSLRRDRAALSRARQRPHRPAPACRRAYNVAAARQALAATICQPTCRMLDSYTVVSMATFVRGDEAISSMNGCSLCMYRRCVADVRPIAHDMCSTLPARRVSTCEDLLGALRACTCCAGTLHAFCIGS